MFARLDLSPLPSVIAALLTLASVGVLGCDYDTKVLSHGEPDTTRDTSAPVDTFVPTVTWHEHVRPIVVAHCDSCHSAGGIGGTTFDTYTNARFKGPKMVSRVLGQGSEIAMPPWPPDPACREIDEARLLTAAQKKVFQDWAAQGYAEGDPSRFVAPTPPSRREPVGVEVALTRTDAYTPTRLPTDDYRCFVFPQTVDKDTWVRAVDISPDKAEVVHHVLLYVVDPSEVAQVVDADAASPSVPGYPCGGGTGTQKEAMLAGWVPGMQPVVFPDNSGFFVPKGARFVAQMHYNTANLANGVAVPADATGARLWSYAGASYPLNEIRIRAVADLQLDIPKNTSNVVEGTTLTTPFSETIIGVIPHMHQLGAAISAKVERLGTNESHCLVDIPRWDFHWQQTYLFAEAARLPVHIGDKVSLRCVYDNSQDNQPIGADGTQQVSRDVTFGEKTTDEMCLAYFVTSTPLYTDNAPTRLCNGFTACMAECPQSDPYCPIDCLSYAGLDCLQCGLDPIYRGCATRECPIQLASLGLCLRDCPEGTSQVECVLGLCASQFQALHGCLYDDLAAGRCNADAQACGIGYVAE
jgi:hypothetical protein